MIEPSKPLPTDYVPYAYGSFDATPLQKMDDYPDLLDGKSAFDKPLTDQWINSELNLPLGEQMQRAKVIVCSKYNNGNVVSSHNENSVLNTMVYDMKFPDGAVREYADNIIAENIFAQVNSDGFSSSTLDGILYYSKIYDSVSMDNQ